MDSRMHGHEEQLLTAERAAELLTRLKEGSAQNKRALLRWLRRSPEAVGEMLLATSTDIVLRQFFRDRAVDTEQFKATASNVISVHGRKPTAQRTGRRKQWAWVASLGIGLAAAVVALIVQPPLVRDFLHPNTFTTSVGEQRAIELADGSAIFINARSSVRLNFSEKTRDVYLSTGQAMFTVAKDPARPFRVHVRSSQSDAAPGSETIIQAVGTKFDVRRRADRINVSVVEGAVQIRAEAAESRAATTLARPAEQTRVAAGEGVSIVSVGKVSMPAPINVADVSAWQQRRLVFADSTLAEIAEEFSLYNRKPHLRVEGAELRARRLSGVFDADSPETLLVYLASDSTLEFDRSRDEIVVRRRPTIGQSESDAG